RVSPDLQQRGASLRPLAAVPADVELVDEHPPAVVEALPLGGHGELLVAGELRTGRRRPLDALKVRIDHAPHEPGFAPLEPHGYVAEAAARRESGRRQRGRQRGHIRVHETAEYAPLAIRARVATERL